MRRTPPAFTFAISLLLAGCPAFAADLRDMKLLEDDAGTRAVLNLQGSTEYKLFTLANPDRLVLDLPEARLSSGFVLPAPNGAVANVRTGKPVPGTLRIVFDLGAAMTTHSRVEKEGSLTRLIVELSPPGAAARIAAERVAAERVAAERVAAEHVAAERVTAAFASPPSAETQNPYLSSVGSNESIAQASTPAPELKAMFSARSPASTSNKAPARTLQDVIGTGQRKLVVAIDAGHGGKDPGAHGPSGVREKVVTLAVARELARQINADPGMRAVLIRDGDTFVPLQQRYMKARAAQADLFISIHADASPNDSASGASVFVLSTRGASSQAARWLADQENAADLVGGVSLDQKDPNLAAVLLDLSQSATMRASDDIANQVLGSLKNVGRAHKPAIERANFVVLRSPDVPSMLIETGFITNPSEEQHLNDGAYRGRLASAISEGVRKYFVEQAPPGSWYASRQGDAAHAGEGLNAPMVASSPK